MTGDDASSSESIPARAVNVVVPVFRDAARAVRCIAQVLASRNATPLAVVAVVGANVHREFVALGTEGLRDARVRLVKGDALDYAGAVNLALALDADRDVVLLQADAEVHADWLDRLAAHARGVRVGVVGTFTNVAGSATYPHARLPNRLPAGATAASLDALFAGVNRGATVEIFAPYGPCLYWTRACIAATGDLHAVASDDGYGAEIDFGMRASGAKFRALIAADVFVANDGGGSFGNRQANIDAHAAATALANLHPAQAKALGDTLAQDPAASMARRVDLARLAASPRPAVVFVAHAWGGGIRRHMRDLAALVGARADVLYLEPAQGDTVKLHWPREGEGFAAWFRLPGDLAVLAETLRSIGVVRLHFHHVHGLPRSIIDLPRTSGLPYDCTLHDYYAICPQYHLADTQGRYCGEPEFGGCAVCLDERAAQWGLDIRRWRALFGDFLRDAGRVIAPSQDVATRIHRYWPALPISVWPHPEAPPVQPPSIVRVVTLGNLSPEKGLRLVAACADDARNRALPLAFRVLGATTEPIAQSPEAPVTIHGSYPEELLPTLLAAERADVLFFPIQVPETYSYTLSIALATPTPIVAAALGALVERLDGRAHVRLLPFDADPAQWNAALLDAARDALPRAETRTASARLESRAAS